MVSVFCINARASNKLTANGGLDELHTSAILVFHLAVPLYPDSTMPFQHHARCNCSSRNRHSSSLRPFSMQQCCHGAFSKRAACTGAAVPRLHTSKTPLLHCVRHSCRSSSLCLCGVHGLRVSAFEAVKLAGAVPPYANFTACNNCANSRGQRSVSTYANQTQTPK